MIQSAQADIGEAAENRVRGRRPCLPRTEEIRGLRPSISRTEIRRALSRARLPFRTACVCRGVNGLIAAVAAGIGVAALAASLVPVQVTQLGPGHRLPELGTIDLVLLTNPRTEQRPAVRTLISTVLASGSRSLTAYLSTPAEGPTRPPQAGWLEGPAGSTAAR